MASALTEFLGNHSPEGVAYQLMATIAENEGKRLFGSTKDSAQHPDRAYLLDLYAECLEAAKGHRPTP